MRLVPVGSLKEGSVIAKSIYNDNGQILLKDGAVLSDSLLMKLSSNQINSIYVEDDYSLGEIEDVISPELRNRAVKEVREVFESVQKGMKDYIKELEHNKGALRKRLRKIAEQKYFNKITDIIEEMMKELVKNNEAMIGLVDIKSMNSFMYQHAVQVTILSLVVGVDMQLNRKELKELAIGAMLHDIGLSMIDPKLWIYSNDFSEDEKDTYYRHPMLGYQFLKENSLLPGASLVSVLEHHETFEGDGYPSGRAGKSIHINARIIMLADTYDMMTSGIDSRFVPPNEAIEFIMGNAGDNRRFDIKLARSFVRRIMPYPIGTYVRLSNDDIAVVVKHNMDHPMRPVVRIIEKGKPIGELLKVDLVEKKNLNLTILGCVYD